MGYIADHLTDGEKIVFLTKRHWITSVPWPALNLTLGSLSLWLAISAEWPWFKYISYFFFIVGGLLLARNLVQNSSTEFGVTNKRVIIKTGLIWRRTQEVILQKVESIEVNQSIPGRILGYGTIIITGSGGSNEPHKNISQPLPFRRAVQEQVELLSKDHD